MAKVIAIQYDLMWDYTDIRLTIQYAFIPEQNDTFQKFTSGNDIIVTGQMAEVDINNAIEQNAVSILESSYPGNTVSKIIYTPFILKTL